MSDAVAPLPTQKMKFVLLPSTDLKVGNNTPNLDDLVVEHGVVVSNPHAHPMLCEVAFDGGTFAALAYGDTIFLTEAKYDYYRKIDSPINTYSANKSRRLDVVRTEPFVTVERLSEGFTKKVDQEYCERGGYGFNGWKTSIRRMTHSYAPQGYRHWHHDVSDKTTPYCYFRLRVTGVGFEADPIEVEMPFEFPKVGPRVTGRLAEVDKHGRVVLTSDLFGQTKIWTEHLGTKIDKDRDNDALNVMLEHVNAGTVMPDGIDAWWDRYLTLNATQTPDMDKLAAVLKNKAIAPVVEQLRVNDPLGHRFMQWLQDGKTVEKKCNNTLLAAFLKETAPKGWNALSEALKVSRLEVAPKAEGRYTWHTPNEFRVCRACCLSLPGGKEKAEAQEEAADWSKRKDLGRQADGLGVTVEKHPLLRAAIEGGNIPTGVFNQPNKQPVNREFALWERALAQPGWAEILYKIAANASSRSTYEKDITPYLMFLFKLSEYLDKHAPRPKVGRKQPTWKAMPTFVNSSGQLEIDEADENTGTIKRRSAFTPVADNETGVVTCPYVAVHIGGVRAQWCYAQQFHIFTEGFSDPVSKGIVLRDYEPKLNGRDDYGLCFYTLIGTDTATGYPTFLIIFERLADKTRVHFHRVRPQRSKNGVTTPACELIEACYQYMAGNIPASEITAQQGDMIYLKCSTDPLETKAKMSDPIDSPALGFESHNHVAKAEGEVVRLYPSEAKTPANRLGFLKVPTSGIAVRHPEHEDIANLDGGWYEIRRARSWEANPTAIWSRTID